MNKTKFRVIFNRTLLRWVVTSELAKTADKSSPVGDGEAVKSAVHFGSVLTLSSLSFSLFCALGFVSLVVPQVALANLEIRADKTAPVNQQPIILSTANGIPQVNIQTPNSKGLSHNKYAQFDVAEKGAILNNSRTTVQTQQGGLVTGNPYLARGEARVILNEVNSANPSQLRGYVEVAGKKADVIIANPSGIHCDGCGVINSGRTTLTTGNPKIKDGQVTGFDVEKGQVKVSGKGLDNSRVDYTEIIARETEINAGIWSNKKLTVVTGENRVQRTETAATKNDNDHLIITHTKPSTTPSQQSEKYAVDVSELGGMYAGKIYLIGTEQGLGVRNAGHIGASAGEVHIDSQGRVVNKGTINANHTIQLSSTKGIENQGKIENRQHDIQLTTQADIQQHGSVVARSGNIHQTAKQGIHQQGETVAKGNIHYQAPTVTASTSSLIAAGVEIKDTPNGETRTLEQHSTQGKNLTVSTTGKTTLQGKNLASGKIQVNGQEINLDNSQTSAHTIEAKASQGDIQANNAAIIAHRDLTLTTPKTLQTQNSTVKAEKITTKQTALHTQHAVWEQTGDSHFTLEAARIDNQGGSIVTQGNFAINTHHLDNTQGKLATNKNLDITTQQGELNTRNGVLFATENITLNTGRLHNENGTILAEKHLQLDTHNQSLNNRQNGQIQALGNMKLSTYEIDNRGGFIQSAGDTTISTALLNNQKINGTGSLLESRNILTLNAQSLLNSNTKNVDTQPIQGIIAGQLNLSTEILDNRQGGIYAENQSTLNIKHSLNNHQGEILSWGNLAILGYATDLAIQNRQGIIQAQNTLDIQAKGISEDGHLEANHLSIQQKDDFNTQNDINAGSSLQLSTLGNITNHHKLSANDVIQLQTQNIDNKVTASISASTTLINAVNNVTNRGLINSYNEQDNGQTIIKAGSQLNNIGTGRIYGDHIALQADLIQNKDETLAGKVSSATIAARQRLDLGAREILNQTDDYSPNKKGGAFIYSGGDIQFGRQLDENHQATGNTAVFRNNSSLVEADKHIALNIDDIENNNIHYRSEIQETGNKTVNKSYIIPTGEAVYNDGNVTAIPTSQLKKFSFSRTWKYAHAYADKDYPVVGKDTKLTGTTALAMPNDISCDSQGHCNLSKAGIYTKDSAVWNYFHITPPAEDMPPLTPEMAAALARIAKTEEYLTDAELDAREQEIAKSGLPTNPTPQERQDYTLLAPYITWTNKYADTYKALSEAIEAQNNRIIGTVYSDFWELNVNREITRENVTQTSLPAQILAGGDITYRTKRFLNDKSAVITGADIINDGSGVTYLNAQNALNLTALSTAHSENLGSGDHYRHESHQGIAISRVQGKGDVMLSGNTIQSEAAQLEADNRLALLAENNIILGTATTSTHLEEHHKYKSGSLAKTTKTTDLHQAAETLVGSQLSGEQIQVMAGKNLHATAVQMVADKDVSLSAVENINILAGTNHFKDEYRETKKTSGVFTGGSAGITFGSKSEKHTFDTEGWTQSDARSAIGSLSGNVSIQAGKHANVLGTDLIAQQDNTLAIFGESLTIEAGKDRIESHESHEYKQSGLTIALSTPVTDAALAAYNTARQLKQTQSSRLQSLYAVKAATEITQAAQNLEKVSATLSQLEQLDNLNKNAAAAENPAVKVSIGYGASQQKTTTDTYSLTHDKSVLSAGNVLVTATDGKARFNGVDIQAENANINAKLGIDSQGVKDTYASHTTSKNSSASFGVFVGFNGDSFGIGLEGAASLGKGKTNIDSETWQNNHWNVKHLETNSEQGGFTLDAATIQADSWTGKLNSLTLQSRQDTEKYTSKNTQASASGSVAYGSGGGASASASYTNAKLDTAQVNEQTGIHLGKGGMDVTVNGHTQLNGAVITSEADAEHNKLTTQTIRATEIKNHSELKTESAAVGTGAMAA
ncbi:hemagglutinin repeat-containing protein, partial [Actinobacillus porcinus]